MRQLDAQQSDLDGHTEQVSRPGAGKGGAPPRAGPRPRVARGRDFAPPPYQRWKPECPPMDTPSRRSSTEPQSSSSLPPSGGVKPAARGPYSRMTTGSGPPGEERPSRGRYVGACPPTTGPPGAARRGDTESPCSTGAGESGLEPSRRLEGPEHRPGTPDPRPRRGIHVWSGFDAAAPPQGDWSSGSKGAGLLPQTRTRGLPGPTGPPSPGGRTGEESVKQVTGVRSRGLSDATGPPTGGWGSDAKGAGPSKRVRPRGLSEATSPPTGGWGSGAKGAGPSQRVRPRGLSDATSPPTGGWGSGAKGAGPSKRVRPRGLSDATSPPTGGWGSGAKGAGHNDDVRPCGLSEATSPRADGWGSDTLGRQSRVVAGSFAPASRTPRRPMALRGAVQRPSAFVSLWDRLPKGPESQNIRRHDDAANQRASTVDPPRRRLSGHMSSPTAMGITEEVYPWMD